jgi:hypothetical protein
MILIDIFVAAIMAQVSGPLPKEARSIPPAGGSTQPDKAVLPDQAPIARPGMTPNEVRALLGNPKSISRQVLYRRYMEQWTYGNPAYLWVEFNCTKGQELHVQNVHQTGAPIP